MTLHDEPLVPIPYDQIMVLSTARRHGRGPQRLPDRMDRGRAIAAVQVENDQEARQVLTSLDRPGRRFYLDVERKQDLHLVDLARTTLTHSTFAVIKPNDITVNALEALLAELCEVDVSQMRVAVYGTGNLGFKIALRLAERGGRVSLHGRDAGKASRLCRTMNEVLPPFSPSAVSTETSSGSIDVLVSAVSADSVITPDWLTRLAPQALCLDVGINNFTADFLEGALSAGHTMMRLDVRSAGDPLPTEPNPFFSEVAGQIDVDGVTAVAGGYIGKYGDVVLDRITPPSRVVGVANGTGGLLQVEQWSDEIQRSVSRIRDCFARANASLGDISTGRVDRA